MEVTVVVNRIESSRLPRRELSWSVLVMLLLLLVQFVVGMFVNLFVGVPTSHPGASASFVRGAVFGVAWAITAGGLALAFHTALGLLLAADSIVVLALAIQYGRRPVIAAASVGLLGIVGAGLSGIGFLNYFVGRATFLMSVGFSVAVAAYVVTLFAATQLVVRRLDEGRRPAG
jgi:hypothetical protein